MAFAVSTRCHTCGCHLAKTRLELLPAVSHSPLGNSALGNEQAVSESLGLGTLACVRSVSLPISLSGLLFVSGVCCRRSGPLSYPVFIICHGS